MIKKVILLLLFIFLAVLQLTLVPHLQIADLWPNFILITAILLLLFDRSDDAYYCAIVGGLILDLAGTGRMATNLLSMIILIFILQKITQKVIPQLNGIIVFIIIFLSQAIIAIFNFSLLHQFPLTSILLEATYSAIVGEIIFLILNSRYRENVIKIGGE